VKPRGHARHERRRHLPDVVTCLGQLPTYLYRPRPDSS
jgi:hypothetical protein